MIELERGDIICFFPEYEVFEKTKTSPRSS